MAAAAAEATQQLQDMRRGDPDEDDGIDVNSLFQPRVVMGPDENGVRKVIEYCFDEEGKKVEVLTKSPVCKLARSPTSRSSLERQWIPNSADDMKGDARSRPTNFTKGILVERPLSTDRRYSGNKTEEPAASGVRLVKSSKGDNVVKECLFCCSKGHHWTAKCPSRYSVVDKPPADDLGSPGEGVKRAYSPFRMGTSDRIRNHVKKVMNDNRCVRVTNLSEGVHESDLVELFSKFGFITCVYMPMDENGLGSGVGYVKFAQRHEAEAAIRTLNGWIYDNLTLQVGWSAPSV